MLVRYDVRASMPIPPDVLLACIAVCTSDAAAVSTGIASAISCVEPGVAGHLAVVSLVDFLHSGTNGIAAYLYICLYVCMKPLSSPLARA